MPVHRSSQWQWRGRDFFGIPVSACPAFRREDEANVIAAIASGLFHRVACCCQCQWEQYVLSFVVL